MGRDRDSADQHDLCLTLIMPSTLQDAVERYAAERDMDGPHTDEYARAVAVAALPLVRSLARRITLPDHPLASYADLENAGMLGMLQALQSYDPARGTPFASFAFGRIRGALVDFLRTIDCLSRDRRRRVAEAHKTAQILQQELGDEPRAAQVADRLGVTVQAYHKLQHDAQQRFALSLFDGHGDEGRSPIAILPAPGVEHADANAERESLYGFVDALVGCLPEREQRIVHLYFFEGLTLREIAGEFHLTEARISQILSKTLRTLRGRMHDHAVAASEAPGRKTPRALCSRASGSSDFSPRDASSLPVSSVSASRCWCIGSFCVGR